MSENRERATALEWLQWFYAFADFGPAESDVRRELKERFMAQTGKALPEGYEDEE